MKRFIIFDLDGTLTEPEQGIVASVKYSLEKLGISDYDESELHTFIGAPLAQAYKDRFGFSEEKAKEAVSLFREYYNPKGIFENYVYSGIPQLLSRLFEDGFTLAVATLKPTLASNRVLEHFGLKKYFTVIAGSDPARTDEVKADIIGNALESLGVKDRAQAVMVGDRKHDILGAAENGIDSVGVLYGHGTKEELEAAGAKNLASTADELYETIRRI